MDRRVVGRRGAVIAACVLGGIAAVAQGPLTNGDIVEMVQAGLGASLVAKAIESAPATAFDTSPDGLIALKSAGVADSVLTAMVARLPGVAGGVPGRARSRAGALGSADADAVVEVPDASDIRLRLATAVSSATAQAGDVIRFTVIEAVKIDAVTVIEKGATANGRVSEVRKAGVLGRAGSLTFSLESVTAIDGTAIRLRFSREVSGTGQVVDAVTAAATGATSRPSPQSIGRTGAKVLSKGNEVTIRSGTEYVAFTDGARKVTGRVVRR